MFSGRYRIDAELGAGGFATVFQATDHGSGRVVAIKVLRPEGRSYEPTMHARFQREVELVGRLKSPHTVRLFGGGQTDDGLLYAIFEHVPGRELSDFLTPDTRLLPREVLHVLRQLLDALAEAHALGLLHRDIKPDNVRVFAYHDDPLTVKLLDFGIARADETKHPGVTRTGEIVGTPRYMSPEQLTDKPLTPASDIYSLGMVVIELLLGPDALSGHALSAQFERILPDYRANTTGLEHRLAQLVARMTARDPVQRYTSAADVLAAVNRIEQGPQSQSVPVKTERSNHGGTLVFAAFVAVMGGIGATAWVTSDDDAAPAAPRRIPGALTAPPPSAAEVVEPPEQSDVGTQPPAATQRLPTDPTGGTSGCRQEPPFEGIGTLRDGNARWFTFVPQDYNPEAKYPLVMLLHQGGENPRELLRVSEFALVAERERFIVVGPTSAIGPSNELIDGLDSALGSGLADEARYYSAWRGDWKDVDLLEAVLDRTAEALCIDPERVFLVANGEGGRAVGHATCKEWVAAVATNSYRTVNSEFFCESARPVPYFFANALHSRITPFNGGKSCGGNRHRPPVSWVEDQWKKRNGCSGDPVVTNHEVGHSCRTWTCATPVTSCYLNGGHGWPGAESRRVRDGASCGGGPPPHDFALAEHIWQFFREAVPRK